MPNPSFLHLKNNVEKLSGKLQVFEYETESGTRITTEFCSNCGTTVYWAAEIFDGMTGIGGGTFDPPTFWYDIEREVFTRSKAEFCHISVPESYNESPIYNPVRRDSGRLKGGD